MSASRQGGKVTLSDVAARARVDASVVSRVLSRDPRLQIRDATRGRVLEAVKQLGYRPNAIARSLRTSRAGAFGLLIPDFTNPIYASIIKGAEAAAESIDCILLTGSSAGREGGTDQYLDLLGQGRVDGLLLAGQHTRRPTTRELPLDDEELLDLPVLLLNRRTTRGRRYVILDDERAAAIAVEHLVDLGHDRIGHLAGPSDADTAQRRRAGYITAIRAADLPLDETLISEADYTYEGGMAAMQSLLSRPDPPTAVFVANVASAIGALFEVRQAGLRVPADLSVVAVHDLRLAGFLHPPLTTVRMPLEVLGRRGIELLSMVSATEPVEEVIPGPMELVLRDSTAPPRR